MKKFFLILPVAIFALGIVNVFALDAAAESAAAADPVAEAVTAAVDEVPETEVPGQTLHPVLMT